MEKKSPSSLSAFLTSPRGVLAVLAGAVFIALLVLVSIEGLSRQVRTGVIAPDGGGGGEDGGGAISGSSGDVSYNVDVTASTILLEGEECWCMPPEEEPGPLPETGELAPLVPEPAGPLLEDPASLNPPEGAGLPSRILHGFLTPLRSLVGGTAARAGHIGCGVQAVEVCGPGGRAKNPGPIRRDYAVENASAGDPPTEVSTNPLGRLTLKQQVERFCRGKVDGVPVPMPGSSGGGGVGRTTVGIIGIVRYGIIYTLTNEFPGGPLKYYLTDGEVDDADTPEEDYTPHSAIYPAASAGGPLGFPYPYGLQGDIQIFLYSVPYGLDDFAYLKLKALQDAIRRHEEVHAQVWGMAFMELEGLANGPTTTRGATHPAWPPGMVHAPDGLHDAGTDPTTPHVKNDFSGARGVIVQRANDADGAFHDCIEAKEQDPAWQDANLMEPPFEDIDINGGGTVRCQTAEFENALVEACRGEAAV